MASSSASSVSLYDTEPDIASCNPGVLKNSERQDVLTKLNAIRARHGLLPVSYDATEDMPASEAALYIVANRTLTINPSNLCYTADAARLAVSSNLYVSVSAGSSTQNEPSTLGIVRGLMDGSGSLGLRRRLLNPFLSKTSFGRVDGPTGGASAPYMASVLKVVGNDASDISAMSNDFIAYPYGTYPASEFATGVYLSFSAIASKTNKAANGSGQVSFSGTTVTVMDGATPLPISNLAADYTSYGLANSLQWKVAGLQPNVTYTVRVDNVIVNGVTRQYTYSFVLQ